MWWPYRCGNNTRIADWVGSGMGVPLWMLLLVAMARPAVLWCAKTAATPHAHDDGTTADDHAPRKRASSITRAVLAVLIVTASTVALWFVVAFILVWLFSVWAWYTHEIMPPVPFIPIFAVAALVVSLPAFRNAKLALETYSVRTRVRCPCRHCGYDLQGNTSGICPECGAPIRREGGAD